MQNDSELREKISKLSNEDLSKMVNVDFAEYREEALQYAEAEMRLRGISYENQGMRKKNTLRTEGHVARTTGEISNEVIVTDIQMPFISMVIFIVKWALAAIPALIILVLIWMAIVGIFGGIAGLGPAFRR